MEKPRYRMHSDGTFSVSEGAPPPVAVQNLPPMRAGGDQFAEARNAIFDGGKFDGGFGPTQLLTIDYWTLRHRSQQLFTENLYARGMIRRLITNEINKGLFPECVPDNDALGITEDFAADWADTAEARFQLWAKNPAACDWRQERTWGSLLRDARREALVSGDVLVVLRQSRRTELPAVQLISGNDVRTPLADQVRAGHAVKHGVEFDRQKRVVAYWIKQEDGGFKRLPAFGERSGRRIAWLMYGTDRRLDEVRGQPLLALVLQSLKEIDRYRDSTQRKALVNSFMAMFVQKEQQLPGTKPMTGGATRKTIENIDEPRAGARDFQVTEHIPGIVVEELQAGEKPVPMNSSGTDLAFGDFEEAIIQAVAWANEIPPEILRLAFSSNYSASQAANSEFRIYIDLVWSRLAEEICVPVFSEWLVSEALLGKIDAPGLLEAWRDPMRFDVFTAWTLSEWYGPVKLSVDVLKQARGSQILVKECWSTNARESRIISGTKFKKNAQRLVRENQRKADAVRPLLELERDFGPESVQRALGGGLSAAMDLAEMTARSVLEEQGQ